MPHWVESTRFQSDFAVRRSYYLAVDIAEPGRGRPVQLRAPPPAPANLLPRPPPPRHQRARAGQVPQTVYNRWLYAARDLPEFPVRDEHGAVQVTDTEESARAAEGQLEPIG